MKKRKILMALLLLQMMFCGGTLRAEDRLSDEVVAYVQEVSGEVQMENEAQARLESEAQVKKMGEAQRRARLEVLRLELERRKQKRYRQKIRAVNFYDNNYFNEARGNEDESAGFHLLSDTDLDLGGERFKWFMTYSPAIEIPYRFKENQVKRFYHNYKTRMQIPLGVRTQLKGSYNLWQGKNRASSESTAFTMRREHNVNSELEYRLTRKISTSLKHQYRGRHFSDSVLDGFDGVENWFLGSVNYYMTPRTIFFFETGGGETSGGNGSYDSANLRATLGVKGKIRQKSSVYLNAGILRKNLSENPPFLDDYTGPYLELIYVFQPTVNTSFQFDSGILPQDSFSGSESFFSSRYMAFQAQQRIWKRFLLFGRLSMRVNDYISEQTKNVSPGESGPKQDNLYGSQSGIKYSLTEKITLGISHAFDYRNSSVDSGDYRKNSYFIDCEIVI